MTFVKPDGVKSPKAHWYLFEVVLDRGPGNCAYVLGEWDGARFLRDQELAPCFPQQGVFCRRDE